MPKRYLTAKEAAAVLEISVSTLYAYVSRGLIRSELAEEGSKKHYYLVEDVEKLKRRKTFRRDPAKVAKDAIHWGTPILDSAITLIQDETLYYRGFNAAYLAETRTFEEIAALLWLDDLSAAATLFTPSPYHISPTQDDLHPIQRYQLALIHAMGDDLAAYTLTPVNVAKTGA